MILIDADRLAASRPNRPLFADVSVTVADGDRLGVVGINGSGKTTLLRMLARVDEPEAGPRIGRRSAGDAGSGSACSTRSRRCRPAASATRSATAGRAWRCSSGSGWATCSTRRTDELSGGQVKRVALATLLAGEHEVLILDEPTNHLDLDAIAFLEEWLAAYRGGLVMVTHDRHVLDRVDDPRARARPRARLPPRAGQPPLRVRLRRLPRGSGGPRGAGRDRRADPAQPRPTRAGVAAPRRAGAVDEAEGARRRRHRAGRRRVPDAPARDGRAHAVDGLAAARVEGSRAARRVVRVAERDAGAVAAVAGAGARRPDRHRRAERRRQDDAARPDRRPARSPSAARSSGGAR